MQILKREPWNKQTTFLPEPPLIERRWDLASKTAETGRDR